jgi:gliding motility-associated protein GldM
MSIPKEPRQLMINVMYLVLTALLALNVSAEIFNAFKIVDKGLVKSNKAIDESNSPLPEIIRTGAKKKASLAKYADLIDPARDLSKSMTSELDDMINQLIDAAGDKDGSVGEGDYITNSSGVTKLKGEKNKDVTTRMLVYDGKGEELKQKLDEFKKKMVELADEEDREALMSQLPAIVDDETWRKKVGVKDWAEFNFKQMPVQATIPILRKFQNDIKSSESSFLNYLAGKVGTTTEVVLDKYAVVSAPEKSYIIKGEKYTSELFLGAFAGEDSKTGIKISVDGRNLPLRDGVASYSVPTSSTGVKRYTATAQITNPATGEVKTVRKEFEYEVGERSVSVSASAMNVFYIGVDNPIEVSAAGVPSNQVKVSMGGSGGGQVSRNGDGTYNVKVSTPTAKGQFAKVNVTAPGLSDSKLFRVKRIPDPIPMLGKSKKSVMGNGEFKAYSSLRAELENFDFDARCTIKGFRLVYVEKRQDAIPNTNVGGKYNAQTQALVNRAKPGDRYFFENIKCNCPGDAAARDLGTIGITIK